jgi:putative transposon-encoded protein
MLILTYRLGAGNVGSIIFNSFVKRKISMEVVMEKKERPVSEQTSQTPVKFEVYGDVLIEKIVRSNGKGGRIYLPPDWVGKTIKIIK